VTRYFIDFEFIEDGTTIDLVSGALVCEDGRELYFESAEADLSKASDWVRENVLVHLTGETSSRAQIAGDILKFVNHGDSKPEFWSWCSAYDWVALCQLYGTMMDKPASWPSYCCDIQQELDRLSLSDDQVPAHPGTSHSALADARWHADIHHFVRQCDLPVAAGTDG
jgi:hypothetical protein